MKLFIKEAEFLHWVNILDSDDLKRIKNLRYGSGRVNLAVANILTLAQICSSD